MQFLQKHHITDLYVVIDDLVIEDKYPQGGRPRLLSDSELATIIIWSSLITKHKNMIDIHHWIKEYHNGEFPSMPNYSAFVDHCHRLLPKLIHILKCILSDKSPVRFMDSTMLPVCKLVRADRHRVAKGIAQFGKNHQGWHYGFKLHLSTDHNNRLSALLFTPANIHDTRAMPKILNQYTKVAVGDGGYNAKAMRDHIYEKYGTLIVAPPHHTQNKKLITKWQILLLRLRPKIESVFGYLKEKLHLVTSYPRSIKGYFLHYMRILLAYQFIAM